MQRSAGSSMHSVSTQGKWSWLQHHHGIGNVSSRQMCYICYSVADTYQRRPRSLPACPWPPAGTDAGISVWMLERRPQLGDVGWYLPLRLEVGEGAEELDDADEAEEPEDGEGVDARALAEARGRKLAVVGFEQARELGDGDGDEEGVEEVALEAEEGAHAKAPQLEEELEAEVDDDEHVEHVERG
eukprot:1857071-Rhodomonas_salina.2